MPGPTKSKPLRETLQEANNRQIVAVAEQGLKHIDQMRDRAVRRLEREGITGIDELADDLANAAKRFLLRGLSK